MNPEKIAMCLGVRENFIEIAIKLVKGILVK